ncbi:MAG: transcriptional regulator [Defluviimonas sp.]|nr:transcriptional regulator [Rhodobiaceae bacterium]MCC0065402.1 transcriptional regulator [Defluviimonas sp.]
MNAVTSRLETALEAHGAQIPDWVRELASYVDTVGLKKAAQRIGYSQAVLHEVIRKRYAGSVERVEERVRGALMGETVCCPVLGPIRRDTCLDWQGKPFAITSAHRTRMYRACRAGCPHSRLCSPQEERDD